MGDSLDDQGEFWKQQRAERQRLAGLRRTEAKEQYEDAAGLAKQNGLTLKQLSDVHYQIMPEEGVWIVNIYPGNRRLVGDRIRKAPYLRLRKKWSLDEIVRAAIRAQGRFLKQKGRLAEKYPGDNFAPDKEE